MIADPGYDDKELYGYSKKTLGIDLVCPVERYESTPKERLDLYVFMNRHKDGLSIPFTLYVRTLSKIFLYILEIQSLCIYTNWYTIREGYPSNH